MKNIFKILNIWQGYKQKRNCLLHFLRILARCTKCMRQPCSCSVIGDVATLPCNLSLMACFADNIVSQGSVAKYIQEAVGSLICI